MDNQTQNVKQTPSSISTKSALGIGLSAGIVLSVIAYLFFAPSQDDLGTREPLYWVAPMDPNFKRDKPGKSPMGMDLIPVYEESGANDSPGTVSIDPVTVQNLGVKTAIIRSTVPKVTITVLGQVQYAQDAIEHIHSRIEGWVEVLNARTQGDFIKQGEPLYSIYSPELVNAQEEFIIALRQNNAALINAAKARLHALAIPQLQIDALEKTRKVSQTVTFLAPVTGFIEALNIQQGFYVKPSMTMMSIASLDKVWVIADVFPNDASMLYLVQHATITSNDLPGKVLDAELDYIYPTLSKNTRTVQARFVVTNANREQSQWLKPEMYTRVHIVFDGSNSAGSAETVLTVPQQAVIRTGENDRVVLALEDGKYKSIHVRLGRSFDDAFEVLDGLSDGDKVVTSAQFLIDSESSINSDFMRMTPSEVTVVDLEASAWTQATVNNVDVEKRKVNLSHGYLDAFDMMGMTMDFTVSAEIDMNEFVIGASAHVEIIKEPSGMFQVKTLHVMDSTGGDHE